MDPQELRKAAKCVYIACDSPVADDLSAKLSGAADGIDKLRAENAKLTERTAEWKMLSEMETIKRCAAEQRIADAPHGWHCQATDGWGELHAPELCDCWKCGD